MWARQRGSSLAPAASRVVAAAWTMGGRSTALLNILSYFPATTAFPLLPPVSSGEAVASQSRRVSVMWLQPSGAVPLLSDLRLALVLSWSATPSTGFLRRRVRVVTPTP